MLEWENKMSNMSVSYASLNEVLADLLAWTYLSTVSDIWFDIDISNEMPIDEIGNAIISFIYLTHTNTHTPIF